MKMVPNYNDIDYIENQYRMAQKHYNWDRAYALEQKLKRLQKEVYGCTWSVKHHRSVDGEKLVTIIIN